MPTGREEIWRFTPLKRLRDLHKEAPIGPLGSTTTVEVEAPDEVGVRTVGADDAARGSSGYVPPDRVSARAWASAKDATVVTRAGGSDRRAAGHRAASTAPRSTAPKPDTWSWSRNLTARRPSC